MITKAKLTTAELEARNRTEALEDAIRALCPPGAASATQAKAKGKIQTMLAQWQRWSRGLDEIRQPSRSRYETAAALRRLGGVMKKASDYLGNLDRPAYKLLNQAIPDFDSVPEYQGDDLAEFLDKIAVACYVAAKKSPRSGGGAMPDIVLLNLAPRCCALFGDKKWNPKTITSNLVTTRERKFLLACYTVATGRTIKDGRRIRLAILKAKAKRSRKDNPK